MNYIAQVDFGSKFFGQPISSTPLTNLKGVNQITSIFVQGSLVLAGIILLFYFIFGGISMIAGAGSNDPQKLEQGKKAATSALIGFIIVFAAYWIVKLVGDIINYPLI